MTTIVSFQQKSDFQNIMQLANPLVSVLMTAYNREKYISEAIDSVIAQSYTNWELIIVDDCSSDSTVSIAKEYIDKDNRIRLFFNQSNLGDYSNRNKAALLANGKWLMWVDSDDKLFSDGIYKCISAMSVFPNALFGMYYRSNISRDSFYLDSNIAIETHFFKEQFLYIGPGGTIINRDFFNSIGGYPEKYGPANDMYFNLKATSIAGIVLLPFSFIFYRIHDEQEQNNHYSYLYNNYLYTRDALNEIQLGLTKNQTIYLQKKSNRRFIINLFRYFINSRDLKLTRNAWKTAGFSWNKFLSGVFH